jgi:hypothetical protein
MPNHFDAESEAIVVEPFTFNGEKQKVGAVFPHKVLGVEVNTTLYGLWRSGRIRFDYTQRATEPEKPEPEKKKTKGQPQANA